MESVKPNDNGGDDVVEEVVDENGNEDEEDSITIHQSDIIPFEDETNYEIDLFSIKGLESTNEESVILNEKSDQVKEENEKCLDNTKK